MDMADSEEYDKVDEDDEKFGGLSKKCNEDEFDYESLVMPNNKAGGGEKMRKSAIVRPRGNKKK